MANATLVINDSEKFMDDIWQYEGDFNKSDWEGSIEEWSEILSELYEIIGTEDFCNFITKLSKEIPEIEDFGDDKLYQLGDLINMLNSIDVKMKHRCKNERRINTMRAFYDCRYDGSECNKVVPKFDDDGYEIPQSNSEILQKYDGIISKHVLDNAWDVCDNCERNCTIDGTCFGRLVLK